MKYIKHILYIWCILTVYIGHLYADAVLYPQVLDAAGSVSTNTTIHHIFAMGQSLGYTRSTNNQITHYAGFLSAPLATMGGMWVVPTNLSFVTTYNSTNPLSQPYAVTNSGTLPFSFSNEVTYGVGDPNWFTSTPQTGRVGALHTTAITASVKVVGYNCGSYTAVNTIYSDHATNSPVSQSISLTINKADQTILFAPIGTQETTNLTILAATASSGLQTTFEVVSGEADLTDLSNLTYRTDGIVVIRAMQAGSSNWNPAPVVTNTITVIKAVAPVTFTNLSQVYDGTTKSPATQTSPTGLTVSLTFDGSPTLPVDADSYVVVATVNDLMYQNAATDIFVIVKAPATITLEDLTQTYDGSGKYATATTAPAGLSVDFTYDDSTNLPIHAGSYATTGTVNDLNYQGSTNGLLLIGKAHQLISFPAIPEQETTNVTTLTASASSGLAISYEVISGPAQLSDQSNLTYQADGVVVVRALQAGDTNWNPASRVTNTFNVIKAVGSVILSDLTQVYDETPIRPTSLTSPTGLTVNLTFDGTTNEPLNVGTYEVIGTLDDAIYQGASTNMFTIVKATNTITFAPIVNQTYTSLVELAATANSGLTVTFAVDTGPASINAATNLSFSATGIVSIVASQIGNTNWLVAPDVTNTFLVDKADQIIDFPVIPDQETTNVTVLSATAVSGLSAVFEVVSGEADLVDLSNLTYRTDGVVVVRALQAGSPYWNAAPNATNTFNVIKAVGTVTLADLTQVYDGTPKYPTDQTDPSNLTVNLTFDSSSNLPVNVGSYTVIGTMDDLIYQTASTDTFTIVQATQTIHFVQIPDMIITDTFGLQATGGDSTNPIVFTVASGPAHIAENTNLTFNNVGPVIITANQAGDSNYLDAITFTNIFNISPTAPVISTPTVSNILAQSASLGGTIESTNGTPVTERGAIWRVDGATNAYSHSESNAYGTGAFSLNVTGIIAGVTNFFQAFAINVSGTVYTAESSFLARPDAPEISTPTDILDTSFHAHWNAAIGAGTYYLDVSETNSFATFVPGYQDLDVGSELGASVTGLGASVWYYYRVRAENVTGISTDSATHTVGLMMDLVINATPAQHDTPTPLGYGTNRVILQTTVTNTVTTPADESNGVRYACTGWTGTGAIPATGTTHTVTFLFATDSSLTWHWKTQYLITQESTGGYVFGLTSGWKDEGWIFDLTPRATNGFLFAHWLTNGSYAGEAKIFRVVADAPMEISAIFAPTVWDVNVTGTATRISWQIVGANGVGTFVICNPSDSEYLYLDKFLFAISTNDHMHIRNPDGTSPAGQEYVDVTHEVQAKLLQVGNLDRIMDPGECITLDAIEFLGKNPAYLDAYFYSKGMPDMYQADTDGDTIPNSWEDLHLIRPPICTCMAYIPPVEHRK